MKNSRQYVIEYVIVLTVMLGFAIVYHFDTIHSGFELFPGDNGDAFLNILAADSWSDVFQGEIGIRQNRLFYPFSYGRGLTDLSLSLYLFELPWRTVFGIGMYSSSLLVYGLLFHFGILCMFYLLRRIIHLSFISALGGALLTFYCNACWVKLLHTQFFFLGLLPFMAICIIRYCQYWLTDRIWTRIIFGMAALLTFACIAYSNYYTAFFSGFFIGIFFIVYFILSAKKGKLKRLLIVKRIPEVLFLMLWGAVLFAPFMYIYTPLMNSDYERTWPEAQGTLPTPADIVNIGPQNLLWGKLYDLAFPPIHKYMYENYHGLPLLTLAVLFFCLYYYWKNRKRFTSSCNAMVITLALLYIISLKFYRCVSLWYFVWKLVPGCNALLAVGRIYVFMMFPLMVFLWWMIDRYIRPFPRKKQLLIGGILFVVLAVDNFNRIAIYDWRPADNTRWVTKITPPPADMKCFFITDSAGERPQPENFSKYGLKAWHMARYFKVFTINGYSGNIPAGYLAMDPLAPGYSEAVGKWVNKNRLDGVYSYDIATDKWRKENFSKPDSSAR